MHEHDRETGRHGVQRPGHRLLPFRSTGHDGDRCDRGEERSYRRYLARRRGHDDQPDRRRGGHAPDGVHQQRLAGEQAQRLGAAGTQPHAGTSAP